jgi:PEP-CTERM motif
MRKLMLVLAGCLMVFFCGPATWAGDISYNVNFTVGAGSVHGFIQTNGAVGTLSVGDIVNWNLLLNDGVSSFDLMGTSNSALDLGGTGFSATTTNLLFNFSSASFVLFQNPAISSGINFLCFEGREPCSGNPSSINLATAEGFRNIQVLPEEGVQIVGIAGTSATPEPSSLLLFGTSLLGLVPFRRKLFGR